MIAFLLVVLLVAFAIDNSQRVTVDYLFGERESRLVFVIAGSALFGAIVDRLFVWRRTR